MLKFLRILLIIACAGLFVLGLTRMAMILQPSPKSLRQTALQAILLSLCRAPGLTPMALLLHLCGTE